MSLLECCLMLIFIYRMEDISTEYHKISWEQLRTMCVSWFKKEDCLSS